MKDAWWIPFAQWTLGAVVMTAVMGWLSRSRLPPRPLAQARRLVRPRSTLVLGLVGVSFFGGIAVLSNVYANKTTTWRTTAIFVGFALMSAAMIADYFFARHQVSEAGMGYGRMLGARGYLRWSDLRRVR